MLVNAGAIKTSNRPTMPMTITNSISVKPRMLSGPRCPVARGRTFEVAENQEWPANPRSRTGCAARARCTFTPRRHVLGRANIWGSVVSTPTNRLASSILKENPLREIAGITVRFRRMLIGMRGANIFGVHCSHKNLRLATAEFATARQGNAESRKTSSVTSLRSQDGRYTNRPQGAWHPRFLSLPRSREDAKKA